MVDFRFDISGLFPQPIIKVTSNLLPHTFRGDRRQALDATSKMSEIIDRLGQLSAVSQKLTKPVTTAQKLRMSDNQIIYILADVEGGHNGSVIGLLKVGTKDLYLFDEAGQTRKIEKAPCILDFYIHESRQRAGLGKDLFETMLGEEHWAPLKCAVDRPSDKLLGFLKKHYGLVRTVPQANNFVLYEGFFDSDSQQRQQQTNGGMHITSSPNTQLFGAQYLGDDINRKRMRQQDASNLAAQITQISPVGRYGARRPTCSMAEGLQDVDDDYLKQNMFSRSSNPRHSGLGDGAYGSRMQVQNPNAPNQQNPMSPNEMGAPQTPSQAQMHAVNQQQQNAQAPHQTQSQMQAQPQTQVLSQANQPGQPQGQMQGSNQQMHASNQQMHANNPQMTTSQMQCKNQSQSHVPGQQQQAANNEPEMCTTCPNCQTTIYLIIHSNSAPKKGAVETSSTAAAKTPADDEVAAITDNLENLHTNDAALHEDVNELAIEEEAKQEIISMEPDNNNGHSKTPSIMGSESVVSVKKTTTFQLSKQHTGMKNISFGVGSAVTPTNKMEFDQEDGDEFGIVKINRPIGKINSPTQPDNADAVSTVSSGEGLTDQGYYDLKFYHNRLW